MSLMAVPGAGEDAEIASLLETVFEVYGYDFRDYALPSMKRRINEVVRSEGLPSIGSLHRRIARDQSSMRRFLRTITVPVSAMYRDPEFYRAVRTHVIPLLRTYPFIRVWVAGCSTGEEAYSLAILLHEEGLYERCKIYATDVNDVSLDRARSGIFPLRAMRFYTANYLAAGGAEQFSDYYTAMYDNAIVRRDLRRNIVFAHHNLAHDGPFNEFHLVVCRNVLIYFNKSLQDRVHRLLYDCLVHLGFLGLGRAESLTGMRWEDEYRELEPGTRLFRRRG